MTFRDMSQEVPDGLGGTRTITRADIPLDCDAYLIGGTSPQTQDIIALGTYLRARGKLLIGGGPHVSNNAGKAVGEDDLEKLSAVECDSASLGRANRQLVQTFHVCVKLEGERSVLTALNRLEEGHRCMDRFGRGIVLVEPLIPREEMGSSPIPDRTFNHIYNAQLVDDDGNVYRTTTAFTSRGCPERCAFCDSPALWGRAVRNTPIGLVKEEFDDIYSRGYRGVYFYDDILPLARERTYQMYDMLAQLGMVSRCNLRTDIISKPSYGYQFLKYLADRGLVDVFAGVESGSNTIKANIHKGTTIEQDTQVLKWCNELGIKFKASVILGLPGETMETMEATRQWILTNRPPKVNVCLFIPFSGIPIVKGVHQARGGAKDTDTRADAYGSDAIHDYDISWALDEAAMEEYFFAGSRKVGGLLALTRTKALSQQQIQDFFDKLVTELDREGIPY